MAASAMEAPAALANARTLRTVSPARVRGAQNAIAERVGDKAFVVVGNDQRVQILQRGKKKTQNFLFGRGMQWFVAFAVDADNLLVTGDDACFEGGNAFGVGDHAFAIDFGFAEACLEGAAGLIVAADTESGNGGAEGCEACVH